MRSRSAADNFPALRTKRCLVRRAFFCVAFAACIMRLVISAKRLASVIVSSMSIFGREDAFGRPNLALALGVAEPVGSASADAGVAGEDFSDGVAMEALAESWGGEDT